MGKNVKNGLKRSQNFAGWWFQPFEKYSKWESSPNRGEPRKYERNHHLDQKCPEKKPEFSVIKMLKHGPRGTVRINWTLQLKGFENDLNLPGCTGPKIGTF